MDSQESEDRKYQRTDPSDFYLEMLLEMAEDGVTTPITLSVSGLLISGELIGAKTFLESFADGAFKRKFEELEAAGKFEPLEEQDDEEESEEDYVRKFIHLRNAKFYGLAQGVIPNGGDGVLWSGRLSAVDGYFGGLLGHLEPKERN